MPAALEDEMRLMGLLEQTARPQKGERVLFLSDYSSGKSSAGRVWRWELVKKWHRAASLLSQRSGFRLLPIVRYQETGRNNAELPKTASTHDGGHVNDLAELVASANVVLAITEYSASAPLRNLIARAPSLRAISMPGVSPGMEGAMFADCKAMQERGRRLLAIVSPADGFEIVFDGEGVPRGTRLFIDTRANNWILEAGDCTKPGDFINLPTGELFTPPYEGVSPEGRSRLGESRTEGVLPVHSPSDGRVAFLKIQKNRIVRVQGDCEAAKRIIEDIAQDENNANIAELGIGINPMARSAAGVPVLESEKAGPHIAYGRNDHFGTPLSLAGKVRALLHQDIVYAKDSPIKATIHAVYPSGKRVLVAERGRAVV
ncbi:MAG: hypothetical protein N3E51_03530 [Candidatus Micrarchaeota archaeon]|nr:hypothetical protein [Candidatus Micrarchaeota archaeon]